MRLRSPAVITAIAVAFVAQVRSLQPMPAEAPTWRAAGAPSCHVIGDSSGVSQQSNVPQGPPSFLSVARGGSSPDELRAFLSHPHGAMPDLSLNRIEIDDLIAYMTSLR
jgi:hypothetical protein